MNTQNKSNAELDHITTKVLSYDIFALTSAAGNNHKPIVLVHGAVASRRYMIPTAKLLSQTFKVFVPDFPGHGASSKPAHALSVQQHAEVLHAYIDALGLDHVDVLANSYGCQIAGQFAASHPDRVDHLILTDPTGDTRAPSLWQQFSRLMMDGLVEPPGAPFMMFFDIYDLGIRRTFETAHQMKADDIRKYLPLIQAKTLFVRGENDFISPQQWCEELTQLVPGATLKVIPKAPHSVNSATAPQLTAIVREFVG